MTHDSTEMIVDAISRLTGAVLTVATIMLMNDLKINRTSQEARTDVVEIWGKLR